MFQIKSHKNYNHPHQFIQSHILILVLLKSSFSINSGNSYSVQFYDIKVIGNLYSFFQTNFGELKWKIVVKMIKGEKT